MINIEEQAYPEYIEARAGVLPGGEIRFVHFPEQSRLRTSDRDIKKES